MFGYLLLHILESCTLGNIDIVASHLLYQLAQTTLSSSTLYYGKTSIPKFKMPLQKELLRVGDILFLLTGDTLFHVQGLFSYIYDLVSIHNGKVGCLFIFNYDRHLIIELADRLVPGHSEELLLIIKSLGLHEIILRYQQSELEVMCEDTSAF